MPNPHTYGQDLPSNLVFSNRLGQHVPLIEVDHPSNPTQDNAVIWHLVCQPKSASHQSTLTIIYCLLPLLLSILLIPIWLHMPCNTTSQQPMDQGRPPPRAPPTPIKDPLNTRLSMLIRYHRYRYQRKLADAIQSNAKCPHYLKLALTKQIKRGAKRLRGRLLRQVYKHNPVKSRQSPTSKRTEPDHRSPTHYPTRHDASLSNQNLQHSSK